MREKDFVRERERKRKRVERERKMDFKMLFYWLGSSSYKSRLKKDMKVRRDFSWENSPLFTLC